MKKFFFGIIITMISSLNVFPQQKENLSLFIRGLDSIRTYLKIPGMAAGVMYGDSILFEKGFGFADINSKIPASVNTQFRIASITKTFTSTIIMQLVEEGKLNLDEPISDYGLDFGNPLITIKHLLTHTSEGEPGTHFQYNGYRFGKLTTIIEKVSGVPFDQLLMEKIIRPLKMTSTAPGIPLYSNIYKDLAQPYELDRKGNVMLTTYLNEFGAFGGLVSNVPDLLTYSRAIDKNILLKKQTQQLVFTPFQTKDGQHTPYGLGWFTQSFQGMDMDIYWHYGQTQGESGLIVKVPSKNLTLVVLCNIDKLSTPFSLGDGDLFTSPVGQLFYKCFLNTYATISWYEKFYNKELIALAAMNLIKGDTAKSRALYREYAEINFTTSKSLPKKSVIASVMEVGIDKNISKNFTLQQPTTVRVLGWGENCSADFSSWCDYGWIENKEKQIVWQMQGQQAKYAGGVIRNQRVDTIMTLPAGEYQLHYKSDSGHAFNNWDSAPPENYYWGIILFKE